MLEKNAGDPPGTLNRKQEKTLKSNFIEFTNL